VRRRGQAVCGVPAAFEGGVPLGFLPWGPGCFAVVGEVLVAIGSERYACACVCARARLWYQLLMSAALDPVTRIFFKT
jgi:hypothetical protein